MENALAAGCVPWFALMAFLKLTAEKLKLPIGTCAWSAEPVR
jgi:hypothetical protein